MIIALVAILLAFISPKSGMGAGHLVTVIRPTPEWHTEAIQWDEFHEDAKAEYADEFTAIFDSLSVTSKRTDKGLRVTVKRANGKLARSYTVKAA